MIDTFEITSKNLNVNLTDEDYQKYIDYGIEFGNIIYQSFKNVEKKDQIYQLLGLIDKEPLTQLNDELLTNNLNLINKDQICTKLNEIPTDERTNYVFYGLYMLYNETFIKTIFDLIDYNINLILDSLKKCEIKLKNKITNKTKIRFKITFLKGITYPDNLTPIGYLTFENFNIKRSIINSQYETGLLYTIKNDEPLIYESGLEKKVLEQLIDMDEVLKIKTQSLVIPYIGIDNKQHNYYPDVELLTKDDKIIIVEIKPTMEMKDIKVLRKYQALKDYCNKNGFGYIMLDQNLMSIEEIINKPIIKEKNDRFVEFVKNNTPCNIIEYKIALDRLDIDYKQIVKIAYDNQKNIQITNHPFEIKYIN